MAIARRCGMARRSLRGLPMAGPYLRASSLSQRCPNRHHGRNRELDSPFHSRMFQNGKTVEQIAREMVDRFGTDAVPVLRKIAAQASAVGDHHEAAVTTPACFQKHRRYGPGSRPRHKWQCRPRVSNGCNATAARFLCHIHPHPTRSRNFSLTARITAPACFAA